MKLLFCILAISTACFAGDYSETQLMRHVKVDDQHAYLYYNWKIKKFFALISDEEIEKPEYVEELIDNCFLLTFKAAKQAFPELKYHKEFYGTYTEDEYEMSVKDSTDPITQLASEITET